MMNPMAQSPGMQGLFSVSSMPYGVNLQGDHYAELAERKAYRKAQIEEGRQRLALRREKQTNAKTKKPVPEVRSGFSRLTIAQPVEK